jgi:hypothetical protein
LNFILKIKEKLENELKNYIDYWCLVSQENDTKQIKWKNGSAIEIILNPNYSKKYNQFYYKIILKWQNLREFLKCIKTKIFRNSNFSVIFD